MFSSQAMTLLGVLSAGISFVLGSGELSGVPLLALGAVNAMLGAALGISHPGNKPGAPMGAVAQSILIWIGSSFLFVTALLGFHACISAQNAAKIAPVAVRASGDACLLLPYSIQEQARPVLRRAIATPDDDILVSFFDKGGELEYLQFFQRDAEDAIVIALDEAGVKDPAERIAASKALFRQAVVRCAAVLGVYSVS